MALEGQEVEPLCLVLACYDAHRIKWGVSSVPLNTAQGDWAKALQDLELAEESFDLCKADVIKSVDNIGLLKLDSVW